MKPPSWVKAAARDSIWRSRRAQATVMRMCAALAAISGKVDLVDEVDFVDGIPGGCGAFKRVSLTHFRHRVGRGAAPCHQCRPAGIFLGPLWQAVLAQKVLVVQQQFLKAGAGHAREFQFRLLRCTAGRTAFRDVLDPAACRLHHLVVSAAALVDVAIAEPDGYIVAKLGDLEALQPTVATMLRD